MKKIIATVVFACLALVCTALPRTAVAGTVTYTASLGPALLDWTTLDSTEEFITLPMFDPSLFGGALPSSMTLSFSGYMSPTIDTNAQYSHLGVNIQNNANSTIVGAYLSGAWTFSLANGALVPNFDYGLSIDTSGTPVNIAPNSNHSFAPVGYMFGMGGSETYSPVPFIGSGNFVLTATNTVSLDNHVPGSNAVVTWVMESGGTVSVTYEVPTPAPLALLGLGLAILAGVSRRKTSRAAL